MYLHLGQDIVVRLDDIIGIFDLENSTIEKATKNYLSNAEKNGKVINVTYEMPKSFIICQGKKSNKKKYKKNINENEKTENFCSENFCSENFCSNEEKVYISQISSQTLKKRTGFIENISNYKF